MNRLILFPIPIHGCIIPWFFQCLVWFDQDLNFSLPWINFKVEQHLASKKHRGLVSGVSGAKAGCFNKAPATTPPADKEEQPTPAPAPSQPSTSLGSIFANEHNFYCQLCKVTSCLLCTIRRHLCSIPLRCNALSSPKPPKFMLYI